MGSGAKVTARDVAELASVSPATVSKALSGNGAVHPDTRERILDAARQLNFRGTGSHLPAPETEKMLTIGLLTRDPFDRRTAPMLLGVLERLTEHDIAFLVCDGRGDPIREQYFIDSLRRRRVDGYLVAGSGPGSFSRRSLGNGLGAPTVYAMTTSTDPHDVSVIPDNRGGARDAVRHLLSTGRRRIAAIFGPADEDAAKLKTEATREVLHEHGLTLATDPLYGSWDEEWGRQATVQLVHTATKFDSILCANDTIARGVTTALQELGISVPHDVAVIGFDNWRIMVEGNRPRLTSIDLRLADVGRTAADKLIQAVQGQPPAPGETIIPSRLIPRESTAVSSSAARPSARRLFDEESEERAVVSRND